MPDAAELVPDVWLQARRVCTPDQLEVLALREEGRSWLAVARALDISVSSARGRAERGLDAMRRAEELGT